jgi:hypothetical protein
MMQFAEWMPDQPGFEGPGVQDVQNVFPLTRTSYSPIASLQEQGNALDARCQGAGTFRSVNGSISNFAADATKIYSYDGSAWADVSRLAGGAYAIDPADAASFTQFGDYVVYANGTDATQVFTLASSSNFSALAGAPVHRFGMVVGPHYVALRYAGALNKLGWCGFTGLTSWTPGIDLSDEQELFVGGKIMGGVGGEYGVVFTERAIYRMNYVGADPVFDLSSRITEEMGAAVEGAIAAYQQNIIFLTWDGFYRLQGGQSITPIGKQRVDDYFWRTVNQSYLYRIVSAFDPLRNLYVISFPSTLATNGTPDTTLFYSLTADRWTKGNFGLEYVFSLRTQTGYNTDTVDAVITNTDFTSYSVDTSLFTGSGRASVAAFSADHKLETFSGSTMEALIETQELQITPGRKSKILGIDPICDGGTPSVSLGYRDRPNDALTWTAYSAQNVIGTCPFRNEARYHRARMKVAAGGTYSHIQGLQPRAMPGAMR